jgi:glycosyltransferase involved in cell wall biosynthesis
MSERPPIVSVIIPCYNATKYITDALNSLRSQTFRNFETILVNDGCPDTENLERTLEPYRGEFVYLKSGKWASLPGSRNNGINASRARYISLLDADDILEPEYLSVLVGMLEADPSIDLVFPNAVYFGESPWVGRTFMEMNPVKGQVTMENLISRECSVYISVTARRESLIRAGLFDPNMRGAEDWDLWMRLARSGGKITYTRRLLARYRHRNDSMSSDKLDLVRHGVVICEKHLGLPGISQQERGWLEARAQKYRAEMDLVLGKQALYAKRRTEAIQLLARANQVLQNKRLRLTILALRLAPHLLHWYIHRRTSTPICTRTNTTLLDPTGVRRISSSGGSQERH